MRVQKISVRNLFGIFNHIIDLNLADRITIIHGPNGVGKTALLRLLNAVLNLHYDKISVIPFSEATIDFDDKSSLTVRRSTGRPEGLSFAYTRSGTKPQTFEPFKKNKGRSEFTDLPVVIDPTRDIEIDYDRWHDLLQRAVVLQQMELMHGRVSEQELPPWLKDIRNSFSTGFIEAQRLISSTESRKPQTDKKSRIVSAVTVYSEQLAEAIQSTLAKYAELSQSLDRTFPARVVKPQAGPQLTAEELTTKLTRLEGRRSQLMNLGLLDQSKDVDFQVQQQMDERTKSILSVYVEDAQQKLGVFNELASRIELFITIINGRFRYKKISISKDKGFSFSAVPSGEPLSPTDLSSGEQHELVLLYELLFKVNRGSLILIDEPELSLHIAWQEQFLSDLQDIIRVTELDVIVATHSPQIINDRWDLTCELKGPKL